MRTRINMPRLGESLVEGTVGRWLKREGDFVAEYEPLLEVITDKVDSEIPSPAEGVLLRILVDEGETVAVGTPLAEIGVPGAAMDVAGDGVAAEADTVSRAEVPAALRSGRLSPVVARLLAEHGLDAAAIPGSGRGGRLTRKDVEAWLARSSSAAPDVPGELRPLTAMRRSIAQHMVRSVQTAPHVTAVYEVDMGAVQAQRAALQAAHPGLRLTPGAWFVAATARALQAHPWLNSEWRADGIFLHHACHIGLAVALDEGLIVPVIRHAERRSLPDLAQVIENLARRARSGQLQADEVQGGTFTITNFGAGGCLTGTPIINQPQVAILGVGTMQQRPVVRDGAIVARPMCYLSLSFDHRVVDGAVADAFMRCMIDDLESCADANMENNG